MKTRDYQLDNIKGLMIILVVLGHTIKQLFNFNITGGHILIPEYLYCLIYSFHMPMFIFISGYLSKHNTDYTLYIRKVLEGCFVPYIVCNIAYGVLHALHNNEWANVYNILMPQWTLWFLLSLVFWKFMVEPFSKLRWSLPISVLLALYIGFIDSVGAFLSLSRTIAFFPYFLAGYLLPRDLLVKIRNNKSFVPTVLFIVVMVVIGIAMSKGIAYQTLFMRESYAILQQSYLQGVVFRGACLLIGFFCILFFITIIPVKQIKYLSVFGMYSLTIYIAHSGIIQVVKLITKSLNIMNAIGPVLFIILSILFSVLVCLLFGNARIHQLYCIIIGKISGVLVKK